MQIISFSSTNTDKKMYKSLQEIDGLCCARCGRKTITHKKLTEERHSIEAPALTALKNQIFAMDKDTIAFRFLNKYAEITPQKTVRDLIAQENVQAAMSKLDKDTQKEIKVLIKKGTKVTLNAQEALKKLSKYKKQLTPNKKIVFEELENLAEKNKDKTLSQILKMPEVQQEYKAKAKQHIVANTLNPRCRRDNPFRFFAQNKNEDDKTIAEKLISGLENTFEHVKRNSDNGQRIQSNGITLCFDCNNYIKERKYPNIIAEYPKMIDNVQKQINEVIEYINKGELINHDNYPKEIKKRLYDESNHLLDIDISNLKK